MPQNLCPCCDQNLVTSSCECGYVYNDARQLRPVKSFCKKCGFKGFIIAKKENEQKVFRCDCDNATGKFNGVTVWGSHQDVGWIKIGPPVYDKFSNN